MGGIQEELKKKQKQWLILCVVTLIALYFSLSYLCYLVDLAAQKMDVRAVEMRDRVGTKVLIGTDSMMIINFNVFNNTYTLQNGQEIDYKMVEE